MRQFRPKTISIPAHAHPTVKFVFQQMQHQQIGYSDLEERSGVNRTALAGWRSRNSPKLTNIEAVLGALGFELVVQRKKDEC